jgi:putative tryptophan/tyrosine transport system substrate-binding protein
MKSKAPIRRYFKRQLLFLFIFGSLTNIYAIEVKHLILLETMPVPVVLQHSHWFKVKMKELGYIEGNNFELKVIKANGDRNRARVLLKKALAEKKPDVVVTNATLASQVAFEILKDFNIPIVFFTVSDPVGAGLIKEIGIATGTKITGKVHMINRQTRIKLVMELIGEKIKNRPIKIGFIHSSYPSAVGDIRELTKASQLETGIQFFPYKLKYRKVPQGLPQMMEEVKKGIELLKNKVDYWWEPSGPLGETDDYTKTLIAESKIPIVMGTKLSAVKAGALLHLTPSIESSGKEAAIMVDNILNGVDPGKIPVTPPSKFDLGINLSTALKMRIVIPPDIFKLAGEHIYR